MVSLGRVLPTGVIVFVMMLAGATVQRVAGLGFGLVAATGLTIALGPVDGILLLNCVGPICCASMLYQLRKEVKWTLVGKLAPAAVIATIPGAWIVRKLWNRLGHGELQAQFGVTMAFVPAYWLFETVGIKGDFGAMIVGLLLVGLLLVAGTALYVSAEFSFVTVDRAAVAREAAGGDGRASSLQTALRQLSTHLSGAQVGITVTTLVMGDAPNQVPLDRLADRIRKLPKVLQPNQVTDLKQRLRALDAVRPVIGMPKGPMPGDPRHVRGARQATRGR